METVKCYVCKQVKPVTEFVKSGGRKVYECKECKRVRSRGYGKKYREMYPDRVKEQLKRYRGKMLQYQRGKYLSLKLEVINAYGGKCACCGESNLCFLTIDHINNDGNIERKTAGKKTGTTMYRSLKKSGFPQGRYQVLCANCNFAKQHDPVGHRCAHANAINIDGGGNARITRGKSGMQIGIIGNEKEVRIVEKQSGGA